MPRRRPIHEIRDIIDIEGLRQANPAELNPQAAAPQAGPARRFLSVWFRCCHTYGRMYRNRDETAYEGRCPRCNTRVNALIGPNGTDRRLFEAR